MTAAPSCDSSELLPVAELGAAERDEMFALLSTHFEGVTSAQFARDLEEKNWAILIRRDGRLCGFSTLLVRRSEVDGEAITAIYSGDTIVAPDAWNSPTLARAWIAAVNRIRKLTPERRCYWLLLSSGFRTYRLLPVFWREFHPRFDALPSDRERRLLVHLARSQYGGAFDPATNIVRFEQPQVLRPGLRAIPDGRENDPHVSFFLARNPGHERGDELVCITEVCEANLTLAGRRMNGR